MSLLLGILSAAAASLFLSSVACQEEIWRIWPQVDTYDHPHSFDDVDGDGVTDIIVSAWLASLPPSYPVVVRIHSGRDGSLLLERPHPVAQPVIPLGDVNGDGHSEYAVWLRWGPAAPNLLEVHSTQQPGPILVFSGPWNGDFGRFTIGINLDNDPNQEIVTSTSTFNHSTIYAHDDNGALLYSINVLANNEWLRGLGRVGDIDGDGVEDFGAGLVEASSRGAVQLYSGRSGQQIHRDLGLQLFDAIGHQVVPVGDYDLDGVPDYATSNRSGARGVCVIFSARTSQMIREWSGYQGLAEKLIAGADYDLDGVPDLFFGGPRYPDASSFHNGRAQAISGRDGDLLWAEVNTPTFTEPGTYNSTDTALGQGLANVSPLPGSPYPIVVVWDWPYRIIGPGPMIQRSPRLRAFRVGLTGTAIHGTGCASTGTPPKIAVRSDPGSLRITLADAHPNAWSWLLVGPRGSTSWQGVNLPYSLASWSMPGCDLLVPPDLIFSRISGTTGWNNGYAVVTAPFTAATAGLGVAAQWLCFDPATFHFAMSPRHELSIQ